MVKSGHGLFIYPHFGPDLKGERKSAGEVLFILNGKTKRGLQEKRKKENYLGSSTYYCQDVKKISFLFPTEAVISCLQSVSGESASFLFFILEAHATLPTYVLLST